MRQSPFDIAKNIIQNHKIYGDLFNLIEAAIEDERTLISQLEYSSNQWMDMYQRLKESDISFKAKFEVESKKSETLMGAVNNYLNLYDTSADDDFVYEARQRIRHYAKESPAKPMPQEPSLGESLDKLNSESKKLLGEYMKITGSIKTKEPSLLDRMAKMLKDRMMICTICTKAYVCVGCSEIKTLLAEYEAQRGGREGV